MKKLAMLMTGLLACSALNALHNGNPASPNSIDEGFFISKDNPFSVKLGYEGDYVSDRRLKVRHQDAKAYRKARGFDKDKAHLGIEKFEYQLNQAVLTVNYDDRFEVYGSLGGLNANVTQRQYKTKGLERDVKGAQILATVPQYAKYETSGHSTWGVGAKAALMDWTNTQLGLDVKYQYARPDLKLNSVEGQGYHAQGKLKFSEWQVGLALSHHVDIFTPYVAVKYSNVHAKFEGLNKDVYPLSSFKMKARDNVGVALGCGLSTGKLFDLNVETRLIDEKAVTLTGSIKF